MLNGNGAVPKRLVEIWLPLGNSVPSQFNFISTAPFAVVLSHGTLKQRAAESNRGKETPLWWMDRRNLGQIHGARGHARGHAEKVQPVVTMIDYNLSMALARHHNTSKILSHNITVYARQAIGGCLNVLTE